MCLFLCLRQAPQFDVLIFFLSAAVIIAVICSRDDFAKIILREGAEVSRLISYSIYMSHIFVLWICNQFVRLALRRPESIADGISTPQLSLWAACLWYGMALGGTIGLSSLAFKFVENPYRLKSKEFARRYVTQSRGGLVSVAVVEDPK